MALAETLRLNGDTGLYFDWCKADIGLKDGVGTECAKGHHWPVFAIHVG